MRPLIALVISATILLGVRGYLGFAASLRAERAQGSVSRPLEQAEGKFAVEITLTFDAEADAFALTPTSLTLKQQDRVLLEREGLAPAGEPLIVEDVSGIVAGVNEFYFECIPKSEQPRWHAVRLRVLRDGVAIAEQTLWAAPGQVPRGAIRVEIPSKMATGTDHAHD